MIKLIDDFLNHITMYRLVLYYLPVLLAVAGVFGALGIMPYDPLTLIISTLIIYGVSWLANKIFAYAFNAMENSESVLITTLILSLIISPTAINNSSGIGFLIFASAWAMGSKYIFAIKKKHVFNPAAFGVALAALTIDQHATWWVGGNLSLLPFVLIGGLLVVRKIKRFDLVLSFSIVALVTTIITTSSGNYFDPIYKTLAHSSFLFFAFVMLTEPLTTPPKKTDRLIYGAIIGVMFTPTIHLGSFYFSPELALIIGNIYSYLVSPKGRFMLTLKSLEKISHNAYEFIFDGDGHLSFKPGQYLEWTLKHRRPDNRGNRRYFTIASSPVQNEIRLGVKVYDNPSSFKKALLDMKPGHQISASHLAGSFTMPKNPEKKLVFIAGGIGITPFRSMIQHLLDFKEKRDIVMFYSNRSEQDIAYKEIFDQAEKVLGIKTYYINNEPSSPNDQGARLITPELIAQKVPDFKNRIFYISGPRSMIVAFEATLHSMGVPRRQIKTDFFPGFA